MERRKKAILEKQAEDSQKALRAELNASRKSQRIKAKSNIITQIVSENKRELNGIKDR
jgi:hypothetical protein